VPGPIEHVKKPLAGDDTGHDATTFEPFNSECSAAKHGDVFCVVRRMRRLVKDLLAGRTIAARPRGF
jgi:hypothetical protein